MAKKTAPQAGKDGQGENIHGYFRKIFQENPKLLKTRSNQELLDRWLADHPGVKEVPKGVKAGLSNVKSVLRSKKRKRKAMKEEAPAVEEIGDPGDRSSNPAAKERHASAGRSHRRRHGPGQEPRPSRVGQRDRAAEESEERGRLEDGGVMHDMSLKEGKEGQKGLT